MVSKEQLLSVVQTANQAPSVHNTQPVRWRLDEEGTLWLFADSTRFLAVGDPNRRDAAISCGAALEGTRLAVSQIGLKTTKVDMLWQTSNGDTGSLQPVARIELDKAENVDDLATVVSRRMTYRGGFTPMPSSALQDLSKFAEQESGISLVTERDEIHRMAELNDIASVNFFRQKDYRDELFSWMRLSTMNSNWSNDGLNAKAMGMNMLEAFGASIVLRSPIFELIDNFGLAAKLVSERANTMTSGAIVLFHRPIEEHPVESGVLFYRFWLNMTRMGWTGWPMAAVADDPEISNEIRNRYKLPKEHDLINVFRFGKLPDNVSVSRARLAANTLIV